MTKTWTRQDIVDHIKIELKKVDVVLAAWEAGSAATHGIDTYSDVDLQLLVDDQNVALAFENLEAILNGMGGIKIVWKVPEPTWHGHSQRFYALKGADPLHLVDCCIIKRSSTERFLEVERHGRPIIYFDRTGTIKPAFFDRVNHDARRLAKLESLKASFPIFQPFVAKEIKRKQPIDAMAFYIGLTMRPLTELLGIKYRPDRFDFGMRYLHRDLPTSVASQVSNLLYVKDPEDLLRKQKDAITLFKEVLSQIEA